MLPFNTVASSILPAFFFFLLQAFTSAFVDMGFSSTIQFICISVLLRQHCCCLQGRCCPDRQCLCPLSVEGTSKDSTLVSSWGQLQNGYPGVLEGLHLCFHCPAPGVTGSSLLMDFVGSSGGLFVRCTTFPFQGKSWMCFSR